MMYKMVSFFVVCLFLFACGEHSSKTFFSQKMGQENRLEELTDPVDKMEAAIFDGNLEKIEILLNDGFGVDFVFPRTKRTLLAESVFRGKPRVIRYLRAKGAKVDLARIEDVNVLEWVNAQPGASKSVVRALTKSDEEDKAELFSAVLKNETKALQQLFLEEVNGNVFDSGGETPLTLAIKNKILNSLRILVIEKSIDVNLKNLQGESPLGIAKSLNLTAVVKELMKRKAQD